MTYTIPALSTISRIETEYLINIEKNDSPFVNLLKQRLENYFSE